MKKFSVVLKTSFSFFLKVSSLLKYLLVFFFIVLNKETILRCLKYSEDMSFSYLLAW